MTQENGFKDKVPQPEKLERIAKILEILEKMPAAGNTSEALAIVRDAFSRIEGVASLLELKNPKLSDTMLVGTIEHFQKISRGEKTVHFRIYFAHVLFIGENGAIEIRSYSGTPADLLEGGNADPPYSNLRLVLQKSGTDGRGVWE